MFSYFKKKIENWEKKKESKKIFRMVNKISKREYKTKWENKFIESVKNKDLTNLTSRQIAKIEEIYRSPDTSHRLRQRGMGAALGVAYNTDKYTDPRFSEEHGVSYADVHDFDK